jgi:hypothetical protein
MGTATATSAACSLTLERCGIERTEKALARKEGGRAGFAYSVAHFAVTPETFGF